MSSCPFSFVIFCFNEAVGASYSFLIVKKGSCFVGGHAQIVSEVIRSILPDQCFGSGVVNIKDHG